MVLPEKGLVSRVSRSPNGWQLSGVEGGLHHVLHVPSGSLWAASLVEAVGAAVDSPSENGNTLVEIDVLVYLF